MIYIPLQHLYPGMILARAVDYGTGKLPLVAAGQELTPTILRRLQDLCIPGVYIESRIGEDIEVSDYIEPKFKQEISVELKSIYSEYLNRAPITSSLTNSMTNLASKLMDYVLSKDEYLLNVIDIRDYDTYTYSHSIYVCILSVLIGMQLGCSHSALAEIAMTGLMHDMGKLDIPLKIINKAGTLTPEEFREIQTHPSRAVNRLRDSSSIPFTVLRGIESHHEKFNGTGYPNRLMGEKIPLYGRIVSVADVYDALTSARPYRRAWLSDEAIEYMMGCAGTHFDYDILQIFLKTVAAYPTGIIVEMSNGFLAVVIKNSASNTLRPVVRVLLPEQHKGEEIDLASDRSYLNVTISSTISDTTKLPPSIFI